MKLLLFTIASSIVISVHGLCSNGPFDSNLPQYQNPCPGISNQYSPRIGFSDPYPRWPSYSYGNTQSSAYSPTSYSTQYPQYGISGPGNGYSYGYNDPRKTYPYSMTSYQSVNYQRPSYPSSLSYNYPVSRTTPFNQAVYGSAYYPSSSGSMVTFPASSSSSWWSQPGTSGQVYPYYNSQQNAPRYDVYPNIHPIMDPYAIHRQGPLSPPARSLAQEGVAVIRGRPGSSVDGTMEFCQEGANGVRVKGRLVGIPGGPGNRGLHILKDHACPPLDQFPIDSKALEHYNPFNSPTHGSRDSMQKHVGDLGNIFVGHDGTSTFDFPVTQLSLNDPAYSVANHSIVITEREDDFGLNPQNIESRLRGNSGKAIACGIIKIKGPQLNPLMHLPPPFAPQYSPEEEFMRRRDFGGFGSSMHYPYSRY